MLKELIMKDNRLGSWFPSSSPGFWDACPDPDPCSRASVGFPDVYVAFPWIMSESLSLMIKRAWALIPWSLSPS